MLLLSQSTHATIFSFGALSSDDTSEIISDSLNSMEWMRLDTLDHLTYAQTVDDIASGSHANQGWKFAHNIHAVKFIDAIFDDFASHNCTTTGAQTCGTTGYMQLASLLGDDFSTNDDLAWFLNDNDVPTREVGYVRTNIDSRVYIYNDWQTISTSDIYSQDGTSSYHTAWLLYRDSTPVPEPSTFALLCLGLFGLGFNKRKRPQ